MARWLGLMMVACLVSIAPLAEAGPNPAKMLSKIKLVDGAGSGLDADMLQGMRPSDLVSQAASQATPQAVSQAVAQASAVVVNTLNAAYTRVATLPVSDGFCIEVEATCADANDFLLNCGGAVGLTTGYLTAVTEVPGAGGTCRAGGCGFGGTTSVAVTATCLPL